MKNPSINLQSEKVCRKSANLAVLFILLLPHVLNGQADNYQLYRCTEVSVRMFSDDSWSEWEPQETNLIMRTCAKENKVEFNNKSNTVFYFTGLIEEKSGTDKDDDIYNMTRFRGYDQDGLQCQLVIIDWPDLPNRNFILEYSDFEVIYFCTLIEKQAAPAQINYGIRI